MKSRQQHQVLQVSMTKPKILQQDELWPDEYLNVDDAGILASIRINERTVGSPETLGAIAKLQAETSAEVFLQTLLDRGFSPQNAQILHEIYEQNLQGIAPTANSLHVDTSVRPGLEKFATHQGKVNAIVRKIRESLQRGAYPHTVLFVTEPRDGKKSTPGFIIAPQTTAKIQPKQEPEQEPEQEQEPELSPAIKTLDEQDQAILQRLLKVAINSYPISKTRRIAQLNTAIAAAENNGSFTAEYYSQHTTPPLPANRAREELNKLVREFEDPKKQEEYGFKFIKDGDRYQATPVGKRKELVVMLNKKELKKPSEENAAELERRVTKRIPDILSGRETEHKEAMQKAITEKIIPNSKNGKWTHYEDTDLNKWTFASIATRVNEINGLNPEMLGFTARIETGPRIAFVLTGNCSKEDAVYTTKARLAKTKVPEGSEFDHELFGRLHSDWAVTKKIRSSLPGKALTLLARYSFAKRAINLGSYRKALGIPEAKTSEFYEIKTYLERILRNNFKGFVQLKEINGCSYLETTDLGASQKDSLKDKQKPRELSESVETRRTLSKRIADATRHFGEKKQASIRQVLWEMAKAVAQNRQPLSSATNPNLTSKKIGLAIRAVSALSKEWPTLLGFTIKDTYSLGKTYYTAELKDPYVPSPIDYNQNYPPYPVKIDKEFQQLEVQTDEHVQEVIQALIQELKEKEKKGEISYTVVKGLETYYQFSKQGYAIPREIIDAALRVNGAIARKEKDPIYLKRAISTHLETRGLRIMGYHQRTGFICTSNGKIPRKFEPSLNHSALPEMDHATILAGTELAEKLIKETREEIVARYEERKRKLRERAQPLPRPLTSRQATVKHVSPNLLERLSRVKEDLTHLFDDPDDAEDGNIQNDSSDIREADIVIDADFND